MSSLEKCGVEHLRGMVQDVINRGICTKFDVAHHPTQRFIMLYSDFFFGEEGHRLNRGIDNPSTLILCRNGRKEQRMEACKEYSEELDRILADNVGKAERFTFKG